MDAVRSTTVPVGTWPHWSIESRSVQAGEEGWPVLWADGTVCDKKNGKRLLTICIYLGIHTYTVTGWALDLLRLAWVGEQSVILIVNNSNNSSLKKMTLRIDLLGFNDIFSTNRLWQLRNWTSVLTCMLPRLNTVHRPERTHQLLFKCWDFRLQFVRIVNYLFASMRYATSADVHNTRPSTAKFNHGWQHLPTMLVRIHNVKQLTHHTKFLYFWQFQHNTR